MRLHALLLALMFTLLPINAEVEIKVLQMNLKLGEAFAKKASEGAEPFNKALDALPRLQKKGVVKELLSTSYKPNSRTPEVHGERIKMAFNRSNGKRTEVWLNVGFSLPMRSDGQRRVEYIPPHDRYKALNNGFYEPKIGSDMYEELLFRSYHKLQKEWTISHMSVDGDSVIFLIERDTEADEDTPQKSKMVSISYTQGTSLRHVMRLLLRSPGRMAIMGCTKKSVFLSKRGILHIPSFEYDIRISDNGVLAPSVSFTALDRRSKNAFSVYECHRVGLGESKLSKVEKPEHKTTSSRKVIEVKLLD